MKTDCRRRGAWSVERGAWSVERGTGIRTSAAFTMIEIAISLAIIGFALVAIIGVLPIGMNAQKENREETIINQEATVLMDAIRSGAQGLDDLANYVVAITNDVYEYTYPYTKPPAHVGTYGYTNSISSIFPLTNGYRIVGLLSTPKYVPYTDKIGSGYYSNNVVAYLRSMSGPAYEKFPQANPDVKDFAFSYRMTSEVIPYGAAGTNYHYYDPSWTSDTNYAAVVNNLSNNLHDVRLTFRWPLRSQGQLGTGGQAFRTLAGGFLQEVNELAFPRPNTNVPSAYDLYFFQPRTYVKP